MRSSLRRSLPTVILAISIVLVYGLQPYIISYAGFEQFEYWFVFSPGWKPEPSWILSLFAHGHAVHLSANVVGLLLYGLTLQRHLNWMPYLLVFFMSGILAGVIHTNLTQSSGVGASGAVMGVIAFCFLIYFFEYRPDRWNGLTETLVQYSIVERICVILAMLSPATIFVQTVFDFIFTGTIMAHLAGVIAGSVFGIGYIIVSKRQNLGYT